MAIQRYCSLSHAFSSLPRCVYVSVTIRYDTIRAVSQSLKEKLKMLIKSVLKKKKKKNEKINFFYCYNGLVVTLVFCVLSPCAQVLVKEAYHMSVTIRVSGRYDTGRVGTQTRGKSSYRAVSYRKRFRNDKHIVQLCNLATLVARLIAELCSTFVNFDIPSRRRW